MNKRYLSMQGALFGVLASLVLLFSPAAAQDGLVPAFPIERDGLTLDRLAQPNVYFDKVGRRFAILGYESGAFEAWAYPLKIIRNFELSFLLKNSTRPIMAKDIARSIEVTPAATTITYSYQSFTVKATYVAAVDEAGAVILLAVDAAEPLTVVAGFLPVLQPMWPAGLGGQYAYWDAKLKAYLISEPTRQNHGYVGSPAAQGISYTPAHMLSDTPNEFTIAIEKPKEVKGRFIPIVLAGGKGKREDVRGTYEKIVADPKAIYLAALEYYRDLNQSTLLVETPVQRLNLAFAWAKFSLDNLRVTNPDLGQGLVAGLGPSGTGGRPGFGWFFGTDAYLNSLSFSSFGAFEAVKEALAFTQKWQREDGKMAHELSQAAGYLNWFKDYPYGYIHADTTPFYIAAVHDYYLWTGNKEFIRASWPSLGRAYEWCLTTDADGDGLMDNSKAGLGALEFGSLTGIQTDIYLAAVWTRAAFGMAELAQAMGDEKLVVKAAADYQKALAALEARFWDAETRQYSYGFNKNGKLVKELTAWCAMPLIWKMGSDERALSTLEKMSAPDLATDWGTRILSSKSPLYEPLNYNYGAVWPFLTGYTATALYNYNCLIPAHQLIRAAAGFMFDNTLGQPTELFSGSLHVWPQEAVAHQGFSAGGFVLPFVRGLLGIQGNAVQKKIVFAPRFPADWPEVSVENIRVGPENFALRYDRKKTKILLIVDSRPGTEFRFNFAPVLGPGTRIVRGAVNGKSVEIETSDTPRCVQPSLEFNLTGRDVIEVEFEPTVEILPLAVESRVGDIDNGLKIVSQQLTGKSLNIVVYGLAGERYSLRLQNSDLAEAATGAEIRGDQLIIQMLPGKAGEFERQEVSLQIK